MPANSAFKTKKKNKLTSLSDTPGSTAHRRRYRYLLRQSDLFAHFIRAKREGGSLLSALQTIERQQHQQKNSNFKNGHNETVKDDDHRHHHTSSNLDDDDEFGEQDEEEEDVIPPVLFTESPPFVKGGKMRPYQLQGLNWLVQLYENNINGILADEMVQKIQSIQMMIKSIF